MGDRITVSQKETEEKGKGFIDKNICVQSGRLTSIPTYYPAKDGKKSFMFFGLAINNHWQNDDGTTEKDTIYPQVKLWGGQADNMSRWLTMGSHVILDGKLDQQKRESRDKNGNPVLVKFSTIVKALNAAKAKSWEGVLDALTNPDVAIITETSITAKEINFLGGPKTTEENTAAGKAKSAAQATNLDQATIQVIAQALAGMLSGGIKLPTSEVPPLEALNI